ncbi:MAG TPA: twin-arginine translocase TatA/TatE family subunit [Candidatus Saccharimonadales bacterium]|nr:twin-arginine translocase TatA/TatE family subunit [Candidatus Saccharimonadales bacterium]
MNFGKTEIIILIVLVVIVLFVGGKKLPELARGVGQAGKELKKGFSDDDDKDDKKTTKK